MELTEKTISSAMALIGNVMMDAVNPEKGYTRVKVHLDIREKRADVNVYFYKGVGVVGFKQYDLLRGDAVTLHTQELQQSADSADKPNKITGEQEDGRRSDTSQ